MHSIFSVYSFIQPNVIEDFFLAVHLTLEDPLLPPLSHWNNSQTMILSSCLSTMSHSKMFLHFPHPRRSQIGDLLPYCSTLLKHTNRTNYWMIGPPAFPKRLWSDSRTLRTMLANCRLGLNIAWLAMHSPHFRHLREIADGSLPHISYKVESLSPSALRLSIQLLALVWDAHALAANPECHY